MLQDFAIRHRHARVELDFALLVQLVLEPGKQGLVHPGRPGLRRLRRCERLRQHHRQELIDIAAAAEKDAERLIEQDRMFVTLHEHGMQGPIEIVARTDAGDFQCLERVEHRARPDRNSRRAQRPREIDDIFGEPAGALPLPVGERVGLRGFGPFDHIKIFLNRPRAGLFLGERRILTPPPAARTSPDRADP